MQRRLLGLSLVVVCAAACRPSGDGAVACGELEARNDGEVVLCNGLDHAVLASVSMPEGTPPAEGWPGVVMLHGSGGLFQDAIDGCSETLHDQFEIWGDILNARGYALILPASFYSRGFCDYTQTNSVPKQLDKHERIVVRTFDAVAAAEWMCEDPRIDCSKLAVFGFSNGASTALMALQDDLTITEDPRLHELDGAVSFVGGIAYYPGCGLEGELADALTQSELDNYYYPHAPVWVPHAEKDKLLDRCEELRDPQVDVVAEQLGTTSDLFELEVYPDAKHGFDVWFTGDPEADLVARMHAQAETIERLDEWLK